MRSAYLFFIFMLLTLPLLSAEKSQDFTTISKRMVQNGCAEEKVQSDRVHLHEKPGPALDLLVYCAADCGAQQCNYSIYLQKRNNYVYRGDFYGRYEILKTKHNGFYDVKIESSSPLGENNHRILKLKGSSYQ